MRIVVQMAMRVEAEPVVERLGLSPAEGFGASLPFVAYEGAVGGVMVALALPGVCDRYGVDNIGSQPATLLAHLAIERWGPEMVVNAGTAGGFASHGAAIGDVYLTERCVVFHDRRIAIEGFDAYGVGSYACVDATTMARELGCKTGVVSSGDALDLPECDLAMMRASGARVKEMEAAAVAWVCSMHGVAFLGVKAITDLVDTVHPSEAQFIANLRLASERAAEAVVGVVKRLAAELE